MAKFYYKARLKTGSLVHGNVEASDPWLARKALLSQNLMVVEISRFSLQAGLDWLQAFAQRFLNRISLEEKLMFINQLETGFSVGIPILQVLGLVQEQVRNPRLRSALARITEDVSQGSSLHQAFEKHPYVFERIYVGLIRTGEATGKLEATLSRLGQILEQQVENRAKIKSATFYPKIVVCVMVMVFAGLVYFVIPKIKAFLATLGQDLPWLTRQVVNTSDFFVYYWYLVLLGGLGAYLGFQAYAETETGRLRLDQLRLRLPGLGPLFMHLELNNYCVILDLLLGSGVTLLDSFEILKTTQSNQVVRNEIDRCATQVRKGGTLAEGLAPSPVFPSNFTAMISMGEEAGMLPKVLQKLAKYYRIQIDFRLNHLSKLLEPILLGVIFVMVGIIALAIFLPIWKMSSAIRPHQ